MLRRARGATPAARDVEVRTWSSPTSPPRRSRSRAGSFDAVTVSFGLRYLDDPAAVLAPARRSCSPPGGRLVVLEFVRPARGAGLVGSRPVLLPAAAAYRVAPRGPVELYEYLVALRRPDRARRRPRALVESAGLEVTRAAIRWASASSRDSSASRARLIGRRRRPRLSSKRHSTGGAAWQRRVRRGAGGDGRRARRAARCRPGRRSPRPTRWSRPSRSR